MTRKPKDTREEMYIAKTVTDDSMFGNETCYAVRANEYVWLNVPYAARQVGSYEDGIALVEAHGYKPVLLVEHHRRDEYGLMRYGKPQRVSIKEAVT